MCDKCDAWLHWGCVGFNAEIVKSSELFICPPCLQDGDSAAPRRTSRKAPEGICPRPDCTLKQVNKRAQPAEEEFTIEKLIGKRRGKDSADGEATWEYLVMWEGYPCDVSEWLPEHDIGGVKALSARFDKEVADEGLTPKGDKELILLNLAVKWGWLKRS
ncbi:hypothetical protein BOTBODRAFT_529942 [Botryobasidium botryosum FD-172 SS1]|uniref:Chromo domain-containing protein n=1 Tax=Botryobasidium botryosum (strain FD-172 SS1) TaxID=930990 RepID=A0A067MBZ0_BOTB1|nr:hypothetical protein BOTBODRAFT_529942 [Botryobasidium botryosum FD-172 SS1]